MAPCDRSTSQHVQDQRHSTYKINVTARTRSTSLHVQDQRHCTYKINVTARTRSTSLHARNVRRLPAADRSRLRKLSSCCFTSTEATYGLLGTGDGRGGVPMNSSPLRSNCKDRRVRQPPSESMLRRWGPGQRQASCVLRNLPLQQLCGTKLQRQSPNDQLLRNNSAARQSIEV